MNSNWVLVLVFVSCAVVMFAYESLKEFVFKGALSAWESHAITIVFTSVLATLASYLMRSWMQSLQVKERALQEKAQALASYELVVPAVNHIINNVLNYFHLIRLEIEYEGVVKKESIELLDQGVKQANEQMAVLNAIESPSDPASYRDIYPK